MSPIDRAATSKMHTRRSDATNTSAWVRGGTSYVREGRTIWLSDL